MSHSIFKYVLNRPTPETINYCQSYSSPIQNFPFSIVFYDQIEFRKCFSILTLRTLFLCVTSQFLPLHNWLILNTETDFFEVYFDHQFSSDHMLIPSHCMAKVTLYIFSTFVLQILNSLDSRDSLHPYAILNRLSVTTLTLVPIMLILSDRKKSFNHLNWFSW